MIMQFACTGSIAAAFGGLDVGFMAMPGALGLSMTGVGCLCLVLIPVVSRCCSGAALSFLPVMPASQYAGSEDKLQASVFLVLMAVSVCAGFALAGKFGFVILACIAGYALALVRAFTSLKGVNGDVAGYALSVGELCGLAALALMI